MCYSIFEKNFSYLSWLSLHLILESWVLNCSWFTGVVLWLIFDSLEFFFVIYTDYISKGSDGETQSTTHKDMSSIYQEQRLQPCQLSSSIHYGGQDIYSCPKSTQDSGYNSLVITFIILYSYTLVISKPYYQKTIVDVCDWKHSLGWFIL